MLCRVLHSVLPRLAVVLALGLAQAAAADAGRPMEQVGIDEGAPWRIDVPAQWNGELVMYLHGYEPVGSPRPPQMARTGMEDLLASRGYAVAQSAYSRQGWAVAEALVENERLRHRALATLGEVKRTWAVGHSMGGHLVLATLERHPQAYDGGLSLCGANGPAAEMFGEEMVPPLLAFDLFFPGVLGLAEGGLIDLASPAWPDVEGIEQALQADEGAATRIAARFDIPRAGLAGGLGIRYGVLRELIGRAGGFPVDSVSYRFTDMGEDALINASVRRYAGDPDAMAYAAAHAQLAGSAPVPVVLLSNLDDPTIPTRMGSRYRELAEASGRGNAVFEMPPRGHGHCRFAPQDILQAMEVLGEWVWTGQRPAP